MSTLYIDRKNTRMTVSGNTLAFYENGERASTLPLHLIDRICIKGDLSLSAADLGKLGAHDIGVLILSGRSQQPAICLPCARKDALRRLAQAHLSQDNPFCIQQAQTWITEKIQREQELLRDLQTRPHHGEHQIHESLAQLEQRRCQLKKTVSDLATLRGIEGSAAAATFAAIASVLPESLHFSGRNRNPPRDPYNVGLSLGYTLLHYAMVRHIHLTGLDPCIGHYHSITHNRESLACDLIEAMRPLVTSWSPTRSVPGYPATTTPWVPTASDSPTPALPPGATTSSTPSRWWSAPSRRWWSRGASTAPSWPRPLPATT